MLWKAIGSSVWTHFPARREGEEVIRGKNNIDTYFIHFQVVVVPSCATDLGHGLDPNDAFQRKVGKICRRLICRRSGNDVS